MKKDKWTHKALMALPAPEREVEHPCPGVNGLRLRQYPSGRKVWVWQRSVRRQRTKITIGKFPAVMMTDAIVKAASFNLRVDAGLSPMEIAAASLVQPRMTVRDGWNSYIDDCWRRGCRGTALRDQMGQKDIVGLLGDKYLAYVTSDDVRACVARPIERAKKITGDGARTGGSRRSNALLSALRTMFDFCIANNYDSIIKNPAARQAVKKVPVTGSRKKRVLSLREMALLILAARKFDSENAVGQHDRWGRPAITTWADIVTVLVMTGNRKDEVYSAMAKEWDHYEKVWRIGAQRYKTFSDALLPVGPTVASIFQRRAQSSGFLFPDQRGLRTHADRRIIDRLTELMIEIGGEPVQRWTMHSTRYGFRAGIRKARIADSELAERVIHPKVKPCEVDYDPEWLDEMRDALARWDALINAEIATISAARLSVAA